jgi:tetratricopeptide (TPR) repeat protein
MTHRITTILCWLWVFSSVSDRAYANFVDTPHYRQCSTLATSAPADAIRMANQSLQQHQELAANYHCRAIAHYTAGAYQTSAEDLARVYAATNPHNVHVRIYITRQAARALVKAGDTERALASLQRELLQLERRSQSATQKEQMGSALLLDRAQIYADKDQPTRAIQELDHAVSLSPSDPKIRIARAALFMELGADIMAAEDLNHILQGNPRHAKARSMLNEIYGK